MATVGVKGLTAPAGLQALSFGRTGSFVFAACRRPPKKQFPERLSELATHGAVEDEVEGTVDEDHNVEDVTQRHVDVVEDAAVDAAEEGEDALRQLGGHEAQYDGDQHRRRAGVFAVTVRLVSTSGRSQPTTLGGRPPHCRHQQAAQHGEQDTRHHLEEDSEQPEVDGGHRLREERGRLEPVVDRRVVGCRRGVVGDPRNDVVLDVVR